MVWLDFRIMQLCDSVGVNYLRIMRIHTAAALAAIALLSACVSPKKYSELQSSFDTSVQRAEALKVEAERARISASESDAQKIKALAALELAIKDTTALGVESRKMQRAYRDLNSNYEYALQNNSRLVQQNLTENKTMLERMEGLAVRLAAKEDSLKREQDRLTGLEEALKLREQRVAELQSLISRKDSAAAYLRQRLADALLGFKDRGLTVSMRNGQVYVSLDNRLMFASGSWEVQPDGSSALTELAKVLNENKDLKIAVEGHTDSDEFNGKTAVKDNWDLSVMRATSVVKILVKQGVKPQRVQAAGRGEHLPVAPNDYPDGKAKNRRTEIIITPNLGELADLIQG